ncbi:PAS domain-containing protein [Arcobacter sp. KX21116]|jgi:PAS domain S-box-containing protein|uniref:sensor histidine kinase n=1 Tax=Arcobacter iocasae TaxID=2906515 RepID=UPI0035D44F83|tara:strand:- start:47892 stop:50090 length:2199 start_codon:yes stop_codon:yes gene_type:complete
MKKLFLLLFLFFTTSSFAIDNDKEVLLLHSYHKGYKWSDDISKAIDDKFASYDNIELTTMYMDTKRILNPTYLHKLAELYKEQLKNRKFDLIIVSDNNAFEFIIKYHEYIFKDIPVLFCGINNFDKALLDENNMQKYTSGVVEQVDLEKNFELIHELHPKMKNLIIINDKSKTGYAVKRDLRPIIKKYKKIFNIEYIDQLDIEKLKRKVKNLDKNDVLLFVLLFKDTAGKYFTYKQSFKQIRDVSKNPIYGLWDFYLNYGIVGGLLTSATAQGSSVANMALQVLHGKNIKDIPILEKSPNRYIFDYNELKKFDISLDKLNEEYTVINEPSSFYKKYTKFIVIVFTIIFVLTIMVISMRANINRRKKLENDLSNRLKFEKVLLDTLPNAIYYKNKDGKFIGSNLAFAKLFNITKQEVIGKTAFDFFPKDIAIKNIEIDEKIQKSQETDTSEIVLHFANLQMKYFILNKAPYENINGEVGGIVCIMDDITERVQQKQFLIQQTKLAEMGDMVAAIAHQWNEPLVELSALVQDIQTSHMLEELQTQDVQSFVKDSMIQIQYMSQTLSDFRNFLKPSTKKTNFSVKQSFDDILEIVGKQLFYLNIKIDINYQENNNGFLVYGYKNEFKQVLLNLVNNAKNKISEKSLEDKCKIIVNVYTNNNYTIIELIDDAGGIDEKIIHSIFDPYFTTKKDGTGIGLYMAKVIIEDKMKGQMFVKNDENKVIFTIKIPKMKKAL